MGVFRYGYASGFDELARKALEQWPNRQDLALPLFYLARHSIELALKDAIIEFAKTDDVRPEIEGHGLMQLWNQLKEYMKRWGTSPDDEWSIYVGKLLNHLHHHDPDGERFHYPENKKRVPFEWTRVDLEDLVRAHRHVTMYCDGSMSMHAEGYQG